MTQPEQADEVVYEFDKPRATVRAYIAQYRGKHYGRVREFVEPRGCPGAPLIATRAGICVEVGDLQDLQACVAALVNAMRPNGRAA